MAKAKETVRKELKVRQAERSPHLYEVYYDNGGELPAVLAGALFTDVDRANEAIGEYLRKRDGQDKGD